MQKRFKQKDLHLPISYLKERCEKVLSGSFSVLCWLENNVFTVDNLLAGDNVSLDVDEENNTVTINAGSSNVFNALKNSLVEGDNINFDIDDNAKTITINATGGGGGSITGSEGRIVFFDDNEDPTNSADLTFLNGTFKVVDGNKEFTTNFDLGGGATAIGIIQEDANEVNSLGITQQGGNNFITLAKTNKITGTTIEIALNASEGAIIRTSPNGNIGIRNEIRVQQDRIDMTVGGVRQLNLQGEIFSIDKPLRLPSLTDTERDALTPVGGMQIYNTTTNKINFYDGTAWRQLDDSAV